MRMTHLYPPGRVLWAMHDSEVGPAQRSPSAGSSEKDKLRLFDVQDVEQVFGQIIFAKDMLRCVTIIALVTLFVRALT